MVHNYANAKTNLNARVGIKSDRFAGSLRVYRYIISEEKLKRYECGEEKW